MLMCEHKHAMAAVAAAAVGNSCWQQQQQHKELSAVANESLTSCKLADMPFGGKSRPAACCCRPGIVAAAGAMAVAVWVAPAAD